MVQAPPSLLWQSRRPADPAPATLSVSETTSSSGPESNTSASQPQRSPLASRHEHTNDLAAIAALKAKQRNKARSPSFTSSPLTQRPLSPSAMSDSGSESSASTARPINMPRANGRNQHPSSPPSSSSSFNVSRRSITALTFGETLASSPSSEDEAADEVYDAFHATSLPRSSPLASSSKQTLDTPLASHRRRSCGPSSPMQTLSVSPTTTTSPTSSLHRAARRRSSGNYGNTSLSSSVSSTPPASPSLFSSSFVGSYEASLLSGRMANRPSNSAALPFFASLGVLGLGKNTPRGLKCPDHLLLPFGAFFWDMDNQEKQGKGSPYVGTIDLEEHYMEIMEQKIGTSSTETSSASGTTPRFPGYRIPPKGQIQLVVKNANQTAVKLFLVPYDLSDMPPGSKTFLRQKSYDIASEPPSSPNLSGTSPSPRSKETLRYAIHLQFCAPPVKERERGRRKTATASRRGGKNGESVSASPRPTRLAAASASPHKGSPSPVGSSKVAATRPRSDTATASHIYLHKNIRIVFTSRALDLSEKLKVVLEGPAGAQTQTSASPSPLDAPSPGPAFGLETEQNRYSAYAGPGEEWETLKRRKQAAEKASERRTAGAEYVPYDPNAGSLSGNSLHNLTPQSVGRTGIPLLNTPPSSMSYTSSSFAQPAIQHQHSSILEEAAPVPEPLTFQRSPQTATVPLPALMESGLSISRPGSRSEVRKAKGETRISPDKRGFGPVMAEGCLR